MSPVACPVIEVLGVDISPKSLPCQVCGQISVYGEGDENAYHVLYDRGIEHPEIVSERGGGHSLLIRGPGKPSAMLNPVICIRLMHRSNDGEDFSSFICIKRRLNNSTKDDYEAFKCLRITGKHGGATVNYAAMASAVLAEVRILASKNLDHCFGSVVACYGKTYGRPNPKPNKWWGTTLLETRQNECIPLYVNRHGDVYFKLTKSIVAVPAYSSLQIWVKLKDQNTNKEILHGFHTSMPCIRAGTQVNKDIAFNSLISEYACLSVSWFGVPDLQPSPVIMNMSVPRYKLPGWRHNESLVEVYSVFIGRDDDAELSISGEIKVYSDDFPCIYHRELDNAERLVRGKKLLSIIGPSSPADLISFDEHFFMDVNLRDASGRFLIDGGEVLFNSSMIQKHKFLYNKLLCSVVQGDGGYCAVHYTPFRNAVRLQVMCFVSYKTGVDVAKVYGSISTRYDMFKYTHEYDWKYFRRVLFDKPEDNVEIVRRVVSKMADERKSNQVAFSTSYVAMPVGFSLLIDVDVFVSSHQTKGGPAEHFKRTLEYVLVDEEISPMEIKGEEFDVLVYAEMKPAPS